ncbi:MAG: class I SAM-dependent methyltransferase [Gaiellales bacterium]
MDTGRFLNELPRLFAEFPRSPEPLDRALQPVQETVEGLSAENNLALIGLAARLLPAGERYAEAGTYHGRTVISAALNGAEAIAIDNFSLDQGGREPLEANLRRFGVADRVRIVEGDTVEQLEAAELPPLGVFYYDADHSTEGTFAALQAVRRHLAPGALVIMDNAEWADVRAGRDRFLDANPDVSVLLSIAGREGGQPWWWDGVDVLAWPGGGRNVIF